MEATDDQLRSFRGLYLDSSPEPNAIDAAVAELSALDVGAFTDVAFSALRASDVRPTEQHLVHRTRLRLLRKDPDSFLAWRFDVFVVAKSARRRLDWWLCTDRTWAVATGPAAPSYRSTWTFERRPLSDQHRQALIDGRARRVRTWLSKPRGTLNLGVA